MKYSFAFSALAALCAAQELPWDVIESASPPPTVTVPCGAASATIIPYSSETAIASVVADIVSDPLPQATGLPATVEQREIVKRASTSTSTVTNGQTTVVTTGYYVSTTRTTVTTTATTYVAPDPTNTLWISPSISDAGKYLKVGSKGAGELTQSNFAPDGREGFRVTPDNYLYSTTWGVYISGYVQGLYNAREIIGFSAYADKSQASPIFRTTDNGDGSSGATALSRTTTTSILYWMALLALTHFVLGAEIYPPRDNNLSCLT
ncbi:hypothetical protein F5Y09DRAFT_340986 [Xylaria sp. FL1042]|nr:hypothetical protein F5Y09DRAFT_340986 [Xylaria sp. FL1042]